MRSLDKYIPWEGNDSVTMTMDKGDVNSIIACLCRDKYELRKQYDRTTDTMPRISLKGRMEENTRLIELLTPYATEDMREILIG